MGRGCRSEVEGLDRGPRAAREDVVDHLLVQQRAGDQRINSFGIGGYLEARAGLLFQKQLLTGGPVHIGLGTRSTIVAFTPSAVP